MARDWTEFEVEAVVSDYFAMLLKELRGERYSKAAHRRALMRLVDARSNGSVEFKHQNISAVLIGLGYPYIEGYKPRWNHQQLLEDAVRACIGNNKEIEPAVAATVDAEVGPAPADDVLARLAPAPESSDAESTSAGLKLQTTARTVNYLEREARNRSLALMGENFALAFEKARLLSAGRERLAAQVDHVSVTQGDGLGFDILSFESDGSDRFIEVKTTGFGRETPFFVSRNELGVSEAKADKYFVYRVFTYRTNPRLFVLNGDLNRVCRLSPTQFLARL
jgi:hypothetical protein